MAGVKLGPVPVCHGTKPSRVFRRSGALQHSTTMPAFSKVFIPTGKVGIAFNGEPPQISRLNVDSPLHAKISPGQVVDQLVIPGVMELRGMTSSELCDALVAYARVEGRFLILQDLNHPSASHAQLAAVCTPQFSQVTDHRMGAGSQNATDDFGSGEASAGRHAIPSLPPIPSPAALPSSSATTTLRKRRNELKTYIEELNKELKVHESHLEDTVERVTTAFQRACSLEIELVQRESAFRTADVKRRIDNAHEELERQKLFVDGDEEKRSKIYGFLDKNDEDDFEDNIPSPLRCPITLSLMTDPVVAADGNCYEKMAFVDWVNKSSRKDAKTVSPLTGAVLEHTFFFPVHSVKTLCQKYAKENPEFGVEIDL